MNKKIIPATLLLVALCGVVAYYLLARQSQPQQIVSPTPTPQPASSSTTSIRVPVDVFEGEPGGFGIPSSTFVNSSTGVAVSFHILNDPAHQNRGGSSFDVLVNQKSVGEAGGSPSMFGFSPDNKLFAFRSRWTL